MIPTENPSMAQVSKSLRTSSAVVPSLILTAICLPAGAIASVMSDPPLHFLFVFIALICPLATLLQIVFFTFADRDRLQNEEHVERKMMLTQMRPEFGDGTEVIEISKTDKLIANPSAKDGDNV